MGQADRSLEHLSRISKNQLSIGRFGPGRVSVCLGSDAAMKPQAQLIFSFAVNLLSRLFPVVQDLHIVFPVDMPLLAQVPRWQAETLGEHIRLFLKTLNPLAKCTIQKQVTAMNDCTLVIGSTSPPPKTAVFTGSNGWNVNISPHGPVPIGDEINPVGAYTAATLGVSEVYKRLLYPHRNLLAGIPVIPLDAELTFSTFTYRVGLSEPNPPLNPSIDIDSLTMVGLGAGGGAAAFTLASLQEVQGTINLVEPDEINEWNLDRYIFADAEDATQERAKTEIVGKMFNNKYTRLEVREFPLSYDKAIGSLTQKDHRYVLAAVHSREARRELQYETPMVLWDAGATEEGEFFIWRMILDRTECMHCKHPPDERDPELRKAAQLTRLLGLSVDGWLKKIRNNETFSKKEISALSDRVKGQNVSYDLPLEGERHSDWEKVQCGRLHFPEDDEEIPVPLAPTMAGVLLAGEIIKEHCFPEAVLDSYYWNTLLGNFMRSNKPQRRLPSPSCSFCRDKAYVNQYKRRWSTHAVNSYS